MGGQLDDIKIGAQGDILPLDPKYKGLTFYDRDPGGGAMGCHNATGATYIGPSETYARTTTGKIRSVTYAVSPCSTNTRFAHVTGTPSMPTSVMWWSSPSAGVGFPSGVGAGSVLGMPRTDGYADGTDSIQGARTYDSSTGTWTTPDAYAGDANDPASQKSYMWNSNSPVQYSDPTGFDSLWIGYSVAFATALIIPVQGIPTVVVTVVAWHAYAVLENDNGNIVKTYSYGPSGTRPPRLNNHYDDDQTLRNAEQAKRSNALTEVGSCHGQCAWERPLNDYYNKWPNNKVPYDIVFNNSNSALSANLNAAGFNSQAPPGAPGWVPGWNVPIHGLNGSLFTQALLEESEGLGGSADQEQRAIGF
ncbi:MAG TPA: hypothetical protein VMV82_00200 [Candidatus Dormibacteraeota bacterium]|nr:hypothetical protein [Candidatus Dormibacteraeota bacterium]